MQVAVKSHHPLATNPLAEKRMEKKHLDRENRHLMTENNKMKQTMRVRATSMVNTRHKHSKYPQHGRPLSSLDAKKYDEVLESIKNDKAYYNYTDKSMKEMNNTIKRNEGLVNKNQHRIKKIDGEYRHCVMNDLKKESRDIWNYFNSNYGNSRGVYPSEKNEQEDFENDQYHNQRGGNAHVTGQDNETRERGK